MDVLINNRRVALLQQHVIGSGGEGTVFRAKVNGDDLAVKIYHQYDPLREKKLNAFLARTWQLPLDRIAAPIQTAIDQNGRTIGLAMPYLGTGFEEIVSLSNKKYRAAYKVNTKQVAVIFLDGGKTLRTIHKNGLIVGDLNDLNALFRGPMMMYIDVDAWQFDHFPCLVGTEQFLAPELYNMDLGKSALFKPEYDWYSYGVMLFKSLLCVHPFGGTHKNFKQLTARAKKRVTIFSPDVTYPKIAFPPDLLDDDLTGAFEEMFAQGRRGEFPLHVLERYADSLVECPKCGTYYPGSNNLCPVCSEKTLMVILKPTNVTDQVKTVELIKTGGPIVFAKVVGNAIYVIAYESGKAVMYTKQGLAQVTRKVLFDQIAGAKYELMGNLLVVNQPGETNLLMFDVGGNDVRPVMRTETSIFIGNRRAIYRTSQRHLFRIVGDSLMYGEVQNNLLLERTLRQVMADQTWFVVKQDATEKPTACGFFKIMSQQMFWLVWEGMIYDNLQISATEQGETLLDVLVRFSSTGALIRRLTQHQGVDYIRTDIVDTTGQVTFSSGKIRREDHQFADIHGPAYTTGKLVHATDDGIFQEDILSKKIKSFDATKGLTEDGNSLYPYGTGLLVVKETSILHIEM